MEKIYLTKADYPMLSKGIEKKMGEDELFIPLCHIDNFVDIYDDMLKQEHYSNKEKELIKSELSNLKTEIQSRNNPHLCGEYVEQ